MSLSYVYQSGQEIKKGDRVIFHGNPGEIEFVANPSVNDPETRWYVQQYGGGVMILEPRQFGRCFVSATDDSDARQLEFVARKA